MMASSITRAPKPATCTIFFGFRLAIIILAVQTPLHASGKRAKRAQVTVGARGIRSYVAPVQGGRCHQQHGAGNSVLSYIRSMLLLIFVISYKSDYLNWRENPAMTLAWGLSS